MLPLPPLDGGRVAVGLLPQPLAMPLAGSSATACSSCIGALFVLPAIGQSVGLNLDLIAQRCGPDRELDLSWHRADHRNLIASVTGLN